MELQPKAVVEILVLIFVELSIDYSMFVLFMEYTRGSRAPGCIFHNQHKTLYNLFSPDQAVSCVGLIRLS